MNDLNKKISHPLQSFEWGEFREKTGVKVVRTDSFQLSLHKIPNTPFNIGYLPKSEFPTKDLIEKLKEIGKRENCVFIQIEPNVEQDKNSKLKILKLGLSSAAHPLFTKYNFVLDITKSEEELLKNMHPKTRYNIRVAQRYGVDIVENNSDSAFENYIKLTRETTKRQKFFAHSEKYHRLMWETLKNKKSKIKNQNFGGLSAHLFTAKYEGKTLVAWIVFVFKDTIYYPYGASSSEHRETMASNLMMWEVIKSAKERGLKKFDMWGALGPQPDKNDPWYGFHRFKEGYGGKLVEYVGSYDLIIKSFWYELYKIADKVRWLILRRSV